MEEKTRYKTYKKLKNINLDLELVRELAEALNERLELSKRKLELSRLTNYYDAFKRYIYESDREYLVIADLSDDELKNIMQDLANNSCEPQEQLLLEMKKRGFQIPEPDIEAF
jgi:hypothetical protein